VTSPSLLFGFSLSSHFAMSPVYFRFVLIFFCNELQGILFNFSLNGLFVSILCAFALNQIESFCDELKLIFCAFFCITCVMSPGFVSWANSTLQHATHLHVAVCYVGCDVVSLHVAVCDPVSLLPPFKCLCCVVCEVTSLRLCCFQTAKTYGYVK